MSSWLKSAIFYEIYPQSFQDTNGDGIGDIPGITRRLPDIRHLGANALWINPCFDSPFKDAGYDVRDYKKVAPRYGTNDDLKALFVAAHEAGMHVILDLVPGHTSEEHPWFLASCQPDKNEFSERYIWSDTWLGNMEGRPFIAGEAPRFGMYMLNFFKCQPALNYGFAHTTHAWQHAADSPEALATRAAMEDVCRFWLEAGCDGFRVDMAASLVKDDDDEKSYTCALWRDLLGRLRKDFPEAVFVSEWSDPERALASAGFDADFYLDHVGNGYNYLVRDGERGEKDLSYFRKDGGGLQPFLTDYLPKLTATQGKGYISFISGNHDTPRLARCLDPAEQALAMAFLLLMPGVPFIYYGDEIGMRYIENMPTKEGGYTRTGTRTPMQWDRGTNLGFSDAPADRLYLPVDPSPDAPVLSEQRGDADSLYETLRRVTAFRNANPELQADGTLSVAEMAADGRAVLLRRGHFVIAVNPDAGKALLAAPDGLAPLQPAFAIGEASLSGGFLQLGPQSLSLWEIA